MAKLRIAQVGTIWETTPPKLYGGTERVVYDLTEELVKKGHDVTLFATGDSKTSGKLVSTYPRAAYRDNVPWEHFLYPLDHIAEVFSRADDFDIIHVHLNRSQDYASLILAQHIKTPVIFTLHFLLPTEKHKNLKDRMYFLKKHGDKNHFVSISNAQQTLDLNFAGVVHNGLDFSAFKPVEKPGKDLVWIGRICEEKGTAEAIQVALKTGMNLILAGKLDVQKYADYYREKVEPYIDGKQIKFIGEVNNAQKIKLLKKAKVLLNPINWNEPFGLTSIEAMAMGVPVIAFNRGPMQEIILDGKTGFLVKDVDEMVEAVSKVDGLNRQLISQYARTHFSSTTMADNYQKIYEQVIKEHQITHKKKKIQKIKESNA